MMFSRSSILSFLFITFLISFLTGCGGSGGETSPTSTITVSGIVQKGLFSSLEVVAYPFNTNSGEVSRDDGVEASTDASDYELSLANEGVYLIEATGLFIDETTGDPILLETPLQSVIDVTETAQQSNVNLFTQLYSQQVIARISEGVSLIDAMVAAEEFVIQSLGLDPGTDFTALDITNIQGDSELDDPNLQLLLFSAANLLYISPVNTLIDFGQLIEDFSTLRDIDEAQALFAQLEGNMAVALYTLAQENLDIPDLAMFENTFPVFTCNVLSVCSWEGLPDILASVVGGVYYEADATAKVTVQLSAPADEGVSVSLQTVDGRAHAGSDYVPLELEILFQPGQTFKHVSIPVILDDVQESLQYFNVQITGVKEGYGISNPVARLSLNEGLAGSDLNLGDNQVRIESFCVTGIGDANSLMPGDCLSAGLSAIPDNNNAALTLDLAMAVDCTGFQCSPWTRNWAVEFLLEAYSLQRDLRGNQVFTLHDSSVFANHRFAGSQLIRFGEDVQSYSMYAHIDQAFRDLSQSADANGWNLRIKARLIGLDSVAALDILSVPLILPETLQAGDQSLPFIMSSIKAGSSTGQCAEDELQLTADFSLDGDVFQESTVCTVLDNQNGSLNLTSGLVNIVGNTIELPAFHLAFQRENGKRPDVRGLPRLTIPDPLSSVSKTYIHADGLPFAFPVDEVAVDREGIVIEYGHIYYLQSGEFHALDPRYNGVTSNDILFQALHLEPLRPDLPFSPLKLGEIRLTGEGINTKLSMEEGAGVYAFPKGEMSWGVFDLEVINGRIRPLPIDTPNINFALVQEGRCVDVRCGELLIEHTVKGSGTMDYQGALMAEVEVTTGSASIPRWGVLPDTDTTPPVAQTAFERPDDLPDAAPAVLSLPGFLFNDQPGLGLDASLYAHQAGFETDITKQLLGSSTALEGNQWPTGISVGPQYYADFSRGGVPHTGNGRNLERTHLILNNGDDNPFDLLVNAGAKYVIRNAGITGAFNIAAEELVNPIIFYGYSLNFDRFAFRVVDNDLDEFSWIDGDLRIPDVDDPLPQNASLSAGAAGFDLNFESLSLDCDGGFSGASPMPDPSTTQRLYAWNADTDIFAMKFENAGGRQVCDVSSKILTLDQTLDMHALDGLVSALEVEWSPDGTLGDSHLLSYQDFKLDGRNDSPGFGITTHEGRLQTLLGSELYGVIKLEAADLDSFLWQSPPVDIRLHNTSEGAERSVVTTAGNIDLGDTLTNSAIDLVEDKRYDLDVSYQWGDSLFGFDLPVYYSSGDNLSPAQFIGRRKEADLMVLQAGAGINYIQPEVTQLSFGISADIKKITQLPISLDLGDAISIERMDDFLIQSGLGNYSLQSLLGPIQENLSVLSNLGGSGLNRVLRNQLDVKIDELVGQQIVDVTQTLNLVQSLPDQFQALLSNETLGTETINLAFNVMNLRTQLETLRQTLISITTIQQTTELEQTQQQLQEIVDTLRLKKQQIDDIIAHFRSRVRQAMSLLDQIEPRLLLLNEALLDITNSNGIKLAFKTDGDFCVNASVNTDNGHLTPVVGLSTNLEALMNNFTVIDIASNLNGLTVATGPELQNLIEDASRLISSHVGSLQVEWNDGVPIWKQTLCADGSTSYTQELDQYLTGLQGDGASILQQSQNLATNLNDVRQQLVPLVINSLSGYSSISFYIDTLIEVLSQPVEFDLVAAEWNGEQAWQNINNDFAEAAELLPLGIEFILADPGSDSPDVFTGLFTPVLLQYISYPDEIRQVLQNTGSFGFSSASFTPDQFRTHLVNKIMDTPAANDLLREVQIFTDPFLSELRSLNLILNDHINAIIKQALAAVNPQINDLLQQAASALPGVPMVSAELNGSAVFEGEDMSQMHMQAGWQMDKEIGTVAGPSFNAALDVYANQANGEDVPCSAPPGVKSFEVEIRAYKVQADLFGDSTTIDDIYIGFILAEGDLLAYQPVSLSGGLSLNDSVSYAGFTLYSFNFDIALGLQEVYIGAGGDGAFGPTAMGMFAFFGRTCDDSNVTSIDPQSANLLPFGDGDIEPFTGLYLRGELTAPIFGASCALDISLRGSAGTWITLEPVEEIGGIVGGGVMGSVACVGSVRGQIDVAASIDADGDTYFAGQTFVIAGAGDCDRHTWTSIGRSRKDKWCGTGDVNVDTKFEDFEWKVTPKPPSVLH